MDFIEQLKKEHEENSMNNETKIVDNRDYPEVIDQQAEEETLMDYSTDFPDSKK